MKKPFIIFVWIVLLVTIAHAEAWNVAQKKEFSLHFQPYVNVEKVLQSAVDIRIFQVKENLHSYASGVLVNHQDQIYLITNQHVFFDPNAIYEVYIPKLGKRSIKTIVVAAKNTDIMILRLDLSQTDQNFIKAQASIDLPQRCVEPYGLFLNQEPILHVPSVKNQSKHQNALSRKGAVLRMNLATHPGMDVAVSIETFHGDSGSAFVNPNGELMGIETHGITARNYAESFLISVEEIFRLLDDECESNCVFNLGQWEKAQSISWFHKYRKIRDAWDTSTTSNQKKTIYAMIVQLDREFPDTLPVLDFKAYAEESAYQDYKKSNETRKDLCGEVFLQDEGNIGFEYDLESQFNLANTFYLNYNADQCLVITKQIIKDHPYFEPAKWLEEMCSDRKFWNDILPWR
ncbi:MAG: trypsin-like peptidase domain-containing protein [Bdellovibrionales bacterium]|nr:trypsin-like peptidase domain-containing protein [Bdellovibrionales bacterium]